MRILFILIVLVVNSTAFAQTLLPYSFHLKQRLNPERYRLDTRYHTALYVGADTNALGSKIDSIISPLATTKRYESWGGRKLFNEHLIEVNKDDFKFYLDVIGDVSFGRDIDHDITTTNNTRGYQFGGQIGKRLTFYSSGFENQARFNDYLTRYINETKVIPGATMDNKNELPVPPVTKDWAYTTAIINYKASKHINLTLGHDKNFIGDGYRSMILSDIAAPYPYFKVTAEVGRVQYMAMWSQFVDRNAPRLSYDNGFRKKWGVFHFVDWNVSNRLSIGFFDAVIWQGADSTGRRGFDVSYLNPIIFLRPVETSNGSPDNALIGLNAKYKLFKNLTVYGQFVADEFSGGDVFGGKGSWKNKFAMQLGIKGFDAFKVKNLMYLAEFNTARPFTYSQRTSLLNYGHNAEPLAHPLGANFKELVSIWDYRLNNWGFYLQGNYARYGTGANNENVGKDIFLSYNTRLADDGYTTGNGIKTSLKYVDARVSYIINPKYNFRLELGGIVRTVKNDFSVDRTKQITFGIRTTFRNIYQDF